MSHVPSSSLNLTSEDAASIFVSGVAEGFFDSPILQVLLPCFFAADFFSVEFIGCGVNLVINFGVADLGLFVGIFHEAEFIWDS